jgi:hypothetical protein
MVLEGSAVTGLLGVAVACNGNPRFEPRSRCGPLPP